MTRQLATTMAFLLALGSAGCSDPPAEAGWNLVLGQTDLDRVVLSAWGSDRVDMYVVGGGRGSGTGALALRSDGTQWQEINTGRTETFWWTWGLGRDNVFFVGEQGVIVHYDGSQTTVMPTTTTETLFGIWGSSANDIWAVGGDPVANPPVPVILHYDGNQWVDATPPVAPESAMFKVWGTGANNVFVVGQSGAILHYDGANWSAQDSGVTASLFTVHGRSATDIYAVGGPPAKVVHFDGAAWTEVTVGIPASVFNGVAVAADGEVLVVGQGGVKFRMKDGAWSDETFNAPDSDLHAVWFTEANEAFAVGGNFNSPYGSTTIGWVGYHGTDPPGSTLR